jgi:ABC-type multidrug transport system fused ATPase/permease subunit
VIDGVHLTGANRRGWQRNIAHVSQTIFLADASIAANIAQSLGNVPLDREKLRRAADCAQLTSFVDSLPDGFETIVGERGIRLRRRAIEDG